MTLPSEWYVDPAVLRRERTAVFGNEWLFFCFDHQLKAPGDYVAADIAGWNLLVLVDESGTLRAHHNVCLHRAGPLVDAGRGHVHSLVCRYHGWAYGLDGGLRAARDFGEFDCTGIRLAPVHVASWRGLVFVNVSAERVRPLLDALGTFTDASEGFPMESFVPVLDRENRLRCNWKAYADNYLEGYHIPLVHPTLNKEIDTKNYVVEVHEADRWIEQRAPSRRDDDGERRWLWRWPNLALNLYPDGMNVERYDPLSPTETRLRYSYAFADPDRAEENASLQLTTEVTAEDIEICEAVQRNLESGVYERGWLSPKHENGVAAFQHWLRSAVT
jgi:choline monooxygenase